MNTSISFEGQSWESADKAIADVSCNILGVTGKSLCVETHKNGKVTGKANRAWSGYTKTLRCSASIRMDGTYDGSCPCTVSLHRRRGKSESIGWYVKSYTPHAIYCGGGKLIKGVELAVEILSRIVHAEGATTESFRPHQIDQIFKI